MTTPHAIPVPRPISDQPPVAQPRGVKEVTDAELFHDMVFGIVVGSPLAWLITVGIAVAARVGVLNGAIMGIVPAFFCGVFTGGMIPFMGRQLRLEQPAHRFLAPVPVRMRTPAPNTPRKVSVPRGRAA